MLQKLLLLTFSVSVRTKFCYERYSGADPQFDSKPLLMITSCSQKSLVYDLLMVENYQFLQIDIICINQTSSEIVTKNEQAQFSQRDNKLDRPIDSFGEEYVELLEDPDVECSLQSCGYNMSGYLKRFENTPITCYDPVDLPTSSTSSLNTGLSSSFGVSSGQMTASFTGTSVTTAQSLPSLEIISYTVAIITPQHTKTAAIDSNHQTSLQSLETSITKSSSLTRTLELSETISPSSRSIKGIASITLDIVLPTVIFMAITFIVVIFGFMLYLKFLTKRDNKKVTEELMQEGKIDADVKLDNTDKLSQGSMLTIFQELLLSDLSLPVLQHDHHTIETQSASNSVYAMQISSPNDIFDMTTNNNQSTTINPKDIATYGQQSTNQLDSIEMVSIQDYETTSLSDDISTSRLSLQFIEGYCQFADGTNTLSTEIHHSGSRVWHQVQSDLHKSNSLDDYLSIA